MSDPRPVGPAAGRHGTFDPSTKAYRYVLLLFVSLLTFGSYFAYDSVGAIETTLIQALGMSRSSIGNLYTAYSVAAIFIVFFGGILIDKLGTRRASLLFSSLVAVGAGIVALAHSQAMLFAGRFVFGAGSESLVVAQSAIIARWFKGKELALAFGIALTISRLGTMFTFNTEELIASHFGDFRVALWVACGLCVLSVLANLVYNLMDRRGEKVLGLADEAQDQIAFAEVRASLTPWNTIVPLVLSIGAALLLRFWLHQGIELVAMIAVTGVVVPFFAVGRRFGSPFVFVTLLCVTFYSAIFPFTALSTDMFHDKWGIPTTAGSTGGFITQVFSNFLHMFSTAPGITSIIIFASMICAPFAGKLVDRIGRRASLMVLGSLIMIPCHLLLGITHLNPIFMMVPLGAAFVLVPAAMWPSVPLIVDKAKVGTAFGLMTAIQNVGLADFPLFNGLLRDATGGYSASQIMFSSLGVCGLVFAVLLLRADKRTGGRLEAATAGPAATSQ
jgi:MFS family permease